jgi:methionyl-tRNA formyltransferase
MRLIFLGSRKIGYLGLVELIRLGHKILACFTYDWDITEGFSAKDFQKLCADEKIPYYYTKQIETPRFYKLFKDFRADYLISFYWKPLISPKMLGTAKDGINIHFSLLPRYRGWAPLNWAIINGEKKAGVSLHYMVGDADRGDILGQESFPIAPDDDVNDLGEKAVVSGLSLIKKTFHLLAKNKAPRLKQDEEKALYSYPRLPIDGIIDWQQNAETILNLIRATTHPYPGAYSYYQKNKLFIWKAEARKNHPFIGIPGQIIRLNDEIGVLTGKDVLILKSVQFEGKIEGHAKDLIKKAVRLSNRH